MIRYILILSILLLLSCKEKSWRIEKFLYLTVYGVTYDSLSNPHLGIFDYFEYSDKKTYRIAKGQFYMETEVAPINGLNAFYELKPDEKTTNLIQKTLSNKDFDSTYNSHWEPRCCYFFYQTSHSEKRIITFGTNQDTPYELSFLMQHLNSLTESQNKLKLEKPFSLDSLVNDFEKELFLKYPPLP